MIVLTARERGWGLLPADEFSAGPGVTARAADRFVRVGFSKAVSGVEPLGGELYDLGQTAVAEV